MIEIIVNGEIKNFKEKTTLNETLMLLSIKDKVMAEAINMEIVKKDDWDRFTPNDGDKLELLQFVGGG